MKIKILTLALLSSLSWAQNTYKMDITHSRIGFEIEHMSISTVDGNFKSFAGQIVWDDKDLSKVKMDVSIQTASINTDVDARDEHLRKDDMFDANKFPTITFKSEKVVSKGNGKYEAIGLLTIKGITKSIHIPFTMNGPIQNMYKQTVRAFKGSFSINRKDFQIGSSLPNAILGEDVLIRINTETIQQ